MNDAPSVSETVRHLALMLLDSVDDMADELVGQILGTDQRYPGTVPADDLRRSVADNMDKIIRVIAGDADDPSRYGPPRATGRRRAEQGLPLEALLHSYRLGGRLIWKRMVDLTRRESPERLDDLLDGATQVWDAIDEYSTVVSGSYRDTEARLARIDLQRQAATVEALLAGDTRQSVLRSAENLLGDLGHLRVVVAEIDGEQDMRARTRALRDRGIRAAWQPGSSRQVGVLAVADGDETGLHDVLRELLAARCGVSLRADGVHEVPTAHEQAEMALRLAGPAPDVALLSHHLRSAVVLAAGKIGGLLESRVLDPIDALPDAERAELLRTVAVHVRSGSVAASASALHCHRNTVLNRLRRIGALTGLDLAVPEDLATLVLALDARSGGRAPTDGT